MLLDEFIHETFLTGAKNTLHFLGDRIFFSRLAKYELLTLVK